MAIYAKIGKRQLGSETCWLFFGTRASLLGANISYLPSKEGTSCKAVSVLLKTLLRACWPFQCPQHSVLPIGGMHGCPAQVWTCFVVLLSLSAGAPHNACLEVLPGTSGPTGCHQHNAGRSSSSTLLWNPELLRCPRACKAPPLQSQHTRQCGNRVAFKSLCFLLPDLRQDFHPNFPGDIFQ